MTRMKIRGLCGGIALAAFAVSLQAWAFGLGNIHVHSYLGQPFLATIPIRVDSPSSLNGLKVSLGSPEQFSTAGIEASAADYSLQFKVEKSGGHPFVKITSRRPMRVPFLNFIVQAQWSAGTLLRQYTVLINPAEYGGNNNLVQTAALPATPSVPTSGRGAPLTGGTGSTRAAVVPSSTPAPSVQRGAVTGNQTGAPSGQALRTSSRIPSGSLYGPVKAGEPFWGIASRARPPGNSVSTDQVLLAIYEANPRAFVGDNFNKLMKGRMLRIPSLQAMRRVGKKAAHRKVMALMNGTAGATVAAGPVSKIAQGPGSSSPGSKVKPRAGSPAVSVDSGSTTAKTHSANGSAGTRNQATNAPKSTAPLKLAADSGNVVNSTPHISSPVTAGRSVKAAVNTPGGLQVARIADSVLGSPASSPVPAPRPSATDAAIVSGSPVDNVNAPGGLQVARIADSVLGSPASSPVPAPRPSATDAAIVSVPSVAGIANGSQSAKRQTTVPGTPSGTSATTATTGIGVSKPGATASSPRISIAAIASAVLAAPAGQAGIVTNRTTSPASATKEPAGNAGSPPKAGHQIARRSVQPHGGWMAWVRQWRYPIIGLLLLFVLLAMLLRRRQATSEQAAREDAVRPDGTVSSNIPAVSASERREPVLMETGANAEVTESDGEKHDAGVHSPITAETDEVSSMPSEDTATAQPAAKESSEIGSASAADPTRGASESPGNPAFHDPLGDADFHIEYGLYDEAIRILNASLEEDPNRIDVKTKLAECYAATENSAEFQRVAEELNGAVSAEEWQRLAEMGRRLCPGESLFQLSAQSEAAVSDGDSAAGEKAASTAERGVAGEDSDKVAPRVIRPETSVQPGPDEFDLSGFDEPTDRSLLDAETSSLMDSGNEDQPTEDRFVPGGASGPAEVNDEAASPFDADHLIEFQAENVSAGREEPVRADSVRSKIAGEQYDTSASSSPSETSVSGSVNGPVNADDRSDAGAGASGSEHGETGYKLDLARAYADMGDNDSARELIDEVIHDGDDEQQGQARKMLEELAG